MGTFEVFFQDGPFRYWWVRRPNRTVSGKVKISAKVKTPESEFGWWLWWKLADQWRVPRGHWWTEGINRSGGPEVKFYKVEMSAVELRGLIDDFVFEEYPPEERDRIRRELVGFIGL